jgi:glycosyltransferase involved in cell wall biosynthesis
MSLEYSLITPTFDEAGTLPRLARSVLAQTALPARWILVDTGSNDGTAFVCQRLAAEHEWIEWVPADRVRTGPRRGAPIVRAFSRGIEILERSGFVTDVVVKLDADLEFEPGYFARLVAAFEADPRLGIASGGCTEYIDGQWRPLFGTRDNVWGASRAYRRDCLAAVVPIEERQGWDELDALRARLAGWNTETIPDLWFRHHREIGQRDGQRRRWIDQGDTAHYMGYRPSYLLARAVYRSRKNPSALLLLWGYLRAAALGKARSPDLAVRRYLREQQRLRHLRLRADEVRGRT